MIPPSFEEGSVTLKQLQFSDFIVADTITLLCFFVFPSLFSLASLWLIWFAGIINQGAYLVLHLLKVSSKASV
jgi:hypothetical protein